MSSTSATAHSPQTETVGAIRVVELLARIEKPIAVLAGLAVVLAFGMILFYTPIEAGQGEVQKIFYVHVPSAWTAFLAVTVVFVASILFLLTRDRVWDETHRLGATLFMVSGALAVVGGFFGGMVAFWMLFVPLIGSTLFLLVYSYVL